MALGCFCVELESDCLEAVRIITSRSDVLEGSALVGSICRLLSKDWGVVVNHIGHDNNRIADILAKWDRNMSMDPTTFTLALADIVSLIEEKQRDSPIIPMHLLVGLEVPFDPSRVG
ncbi:hypothetical protein V6N11_009836 [Hibiscus sabdariffa]|uniref:RNase H type-1 domain-containing protein n=2 Tax=Hibiscus sabdariffa TaxID=183260 RepID=A0ABR2BWP3_9ROSI